jgi:hypothetical protein
LTRSSVAPATAALIDPVLRSSSEASAAAPADMLSTEIAVPEAPLRYHASTCTGIALST